MNPALMERFGRLRIAVLGDFAVDHYLVGKTARISREAPVLILRKKEDSVRPGQAGNSAANLAALGVRCFAVGVVGSDDHGARLVRSMSDLGIDTSAMVRARGSRSLVKTRILAGAHHTALQQVIRMDDDEGLEITRAVRTRLREGLERLLPDLDAVLVSDYGYGAADRALWDLIGGFAGVKRVLDSRYSLEEFKGADAITPNETEVFSHLGMERFDRADPVRAGRDLIGRTGCRGLIMTRGNEGMLVFDDPESDPTDIAVFGGDEITDVTGAGDTVSAVVTAALASGASLVSSARLANVAAGLSVMKRGAATVTPDEIRAALSTDR